MTRILLTAMFSVATVGYAVAADLPPAVAPAPRAPVAYLPAAPIYNWGGFYFGLNGGYAFGKTDWTVPGVTTGNFSANGGIIGGTVGANWQADAFVFGLEGDYDGSWVDGKDSTCFLANCETKNTWLATLRGRIGYAADRVLFYGTGGGAFGNMVVNSASTFQSTNKAGWTAGAGIEGAFTDNLTARVEYLFVDLENGSFTCSACAPGPLPLTVKLYENLIRVGVDYKFQ